VSLPSLASVDMCIVEARRASYRGLGGVPDIKQRKSGSLNLGDHLEFPGRGYSEPLCSSGPSGHFCRDRIIVEVAVSC
jgi:hypothetical protein